ncbi:hypothetical protein ACE193_17840 [Bernardetia sp. OM2101]|uniref:hypothetical protein n=1 Tax=Bernardetia sp. OM2101 TaxID=3344876 RepID=UPI0035D11FE5
MKNIFALTVFFFAFIASSFACLNTNQLKLFPIGIYNNTVISIDVEITRRFAREVADKYNLTISDSIEHHSGFLLKTRLSVYDLNQKLISSKIIDSTYAIGRSYLKELSKSHGKALKAILKKYPTIELFEVKYLSFCDFQKECNYLSMQYDTLTKTISLDYAKQKYDLAVFKDKNNYYLNDDYLEYPARYFTISSIRIYETKKVKLVIAHLGTEETQTVLADLPKKEYKDEKINYSSIKTFINQEPVNHHGEGMDVFFSIVK